MTHHSEPAEAVAVKRIADLLDENAECYSENAMDRAFLGNSEELAALIVKVQALSATPAPSASGGLEAAVRRAKYLLDRMENDDGIGIGEFDTMLRMVIALASPAATSAETQGGDGDDGTVAQRKEHAEPDEGRQDAGSTPAGFAASICDCERAHNGLGISGRECDCQADNERCTGCYGTGWDSNAERFCHCEDGAIAALAPSTSAATRGEPVAFMAHDRMRAITQRELDTVPETNGRRSNCKALYPTALYAAPPAPAVESAQVKEGRSDG